MARWVVLNLKQKLRIEQICKYLDVSVDGFDQLQPEYMTQCFNPQILDRPDVIYSSYGACKDDVPFYSPLYFSNKYLREIEGRNDGLVSLKSAQWGNDFTIVENCDHRDVINWNPWFDALPIYHKILSWQSNQEELQQSENLVDSNSNNNTQQIMYLFTPNNNNNNNNNYNNKSLLAIITGILWQINN
ncbi:hypothetical protein DFA_03075 [Cavenderia fasciculata]|uniref:Uncharacterized protein n=1 Tax=Cavenderia fasciculata TaxID=261658 RepID=F4PGJ6_CACFS|nr:uncharacterized protein DFA_03075 [Cavenderia fasciculata]EGG24830.1 hypothetical protein DFA_03075 [Cavenderia fasciculata]|eukprot:XP_004362681.1 hypothetical protein DFA_03075 [Cavenderia fasciculata]